MKKNLIELCEDLQIPSPTVSGEKGPYLLPLTDTIHVAVRMLDPGVYFSSPIAPCPKVKREELFIQLMKANLFGQGTLGATIGYKDDENLLTLSSAFPYDMDYRAFKESVEDFANIVDYWKGEITMHIRRAQEEIL